MNNSTTSNTQSITITKLLNICEKVRLGLMTEREGVNQFQQIEQLLNKQMLSSSLQQFIEELRQYTSLGTVATSQTASLRGLVQPARINSTVLPDYIELIPDVNNGLVHGVIVHNKNFKLVCKAHRWFKYQVLSPGVGGPTSWIKIKEEAAGACWQYNLKGQLIASQSWHSARVFPEVFFDPKTKLSGQACECYRNTKDYTGTGSEFGYEGYYLPELKANYMNWFAVLMELIPPGTDINNPNLKIPLYCKDSGQLNSQFYAPDAASQFFGKSVNQDQAIENALFNQPVSPFSILAVNTPYLKVLAPSYEADEVSIYLIGAHRSVTATTIAAKNTYSAFERNAEWYGRTFHKV